MSEQRHRAVLHIGAPKCGSSALQTALSERPNLRGQDGTRYRYTAFVPDLKGWRVVRGRTVTWSARITPFGYGSWLDPKTAQGDIPFWARFTEEIAGTGGAVPILSNESWMSRSPVFAPHISQPLLAVGFLRPPLDWLNAAYWQWAVWGNSPFERWVRRRPHYTPGQWLSGWADIPGVTLRCSSASPDVMASFGRKVGIGNLTSEVQNASSPAALIGFLLRNRRYRPNVHAAAVEFVIQRWCRFTALKKAWAVPDDVVAELAIAMERETEIMRHVLPEEDAEEILSTPGWTEIDAAQRPCTAVDDLDELPKLLDALIEGLAWCRRAIGDTADARPDTPEGNDDVAIWDATIADVVDALISADLEWRRRRMPLILKAACRLHPQGERFMPRPIQIS
ncbi:MAG: hypothetical protein AAF919_11855 [Pseudomonadota bacterium]